MSLGEHLLELKRRLFISGIALVIGAIGGWVLTEFVWDALREPITRIAEARNATINYPGITTAFDIRLQLAVTIGLVIASPVWLYQIFAFLVPGLTSKEKRYTFGFFFSAVPLFLGGCATGWFVLPHIVELMASFVPSEDASIVDARIYFDFVLKLVIATGVAFVLPVFLVILNFLGVISATSILKGWRVAILIITLFTAIVTPAADVLSMFLLAIPMVFLYFAAAGVAYLHDRRMAARNQQVEESLAT
ncbi:MAG: twin-arginine translocase subunit TatC [Actinomycetota bacterium]|nr:twin-arginine translocase subunit TatC [Actinomycetota bacterium]